MTVSLNQKFEGAAHQIFNKKGGVALFADLFDCFVRVNLFVSERNQCQDSVGDARIGSVGGTRGLPRGSDAHFVFELHDDPLGGFFADPFRFGQQRRIIVNDGGFKLYDRDAAQDIKRCFGTNAGDVQDQEPEKVAFGRRHEAVEDMCVFTDLKMR
ncbi:MAG: hypothetical protein JWL90_4475 [Chthoniobacteraceae bacterium]|nr:hypothetical protein [Chthoniobacteraceae bacterium]